MINKKIISTALLAGTIALNCSLLTGCGENSAALTANVKTFKLEKKELTNSVSATGTIDGVRIDIENLQKTKAIKVCVREGDYIKKGDVLFEFDTTELEEQYDKLTSQYEKEDDKIKHDQSINENKLNSTKQEKEAMLNQAQRKIDEAVAARDEAYSNRDNLQSQYDSAFDEINSLTEQLNNASSEDEYASLETKIENASMKLSQLEAELEQANSSLSSYDNLVNDAEDNYSNTERQYNEMVSDAQNVIETEKFVTNSIEKDELNKLKEQMESCIVTSPVSGVVVAPQVIEGAVPMTETLVTIVDTSDLSVNVNISEYDIPNINKDMDVLIKTAATGTDEINGSIKRISHMSTASENGVSYPVEIDIDESSLNKELFLGMTARTEIITSRTEDVFSVPYDVFSQDITNLNDLYIMIAEPDGDGYTTRKIAVELGEESSYYVEVISDELEEGMFVIYDSTGIKEGKKVNVVVE